MFSTITNELDAYANVNAEYGGGFVHENIDNHDPSALTLASKVSETQAVLTKSGQAGPISSETRLSTYYNPYDVFTSSYGIVKNTFVLPAHASFSMSGEIHFALNQFADLHKYYAGEAHSTLYLASDASDIFWRNDSISLAHGTAHNEFTKDFSVFFTNQSDRDINLYWNMTVGSYSKLGVPSIPEPATYGMLAGGLLLLLAAARRKASRV